MSHSTMAPADNDNTQPLLSPKDLNLSVQMEGNTSQISNRDRKYSNSSSTLSTSASSSNPSSGSISSIRESESNQLIVSPLSLPAHSPFDMNSLKINPNLTHKKSQSIDILLSSKVKQELDILNDSESESHSHSDHDHTEKQRSASQPPPITEKYYPFSIRTFLHNEMEYVDVAISPKTSRQKFTFNQKSEENNLKNQSAEERIHNFFWIFFALEKLLFFGFWICCDSFLLTMTILPTRVCYRLFMKLSYFLKNESMLFYYHYFRFYVFYYFHVFKNCTIIKIICKIYEKVLDFMCCCGHRFKKHDLIQINFDNDNNDKYKLYFDGTYTFLRKTLCILSCCCLCHKEIYYNQHYDDDTKLLSTKQSKTADPKWLNALKKETYFKRMEFIKNNGLGYKYSGRDWLDIIRLFTLLLCVYILTQLNLSQIYHFIRAQENFKLYVLFKIIVIIEHLFASFGEDAIESLFNSLSNKKLHKCHRKLVINLLIYVIYNVLHCLLLYGHLITLNAAMNSPNNTLITILVADNFYELKSNVFKRYRIENLFQMACSDIVERFTTFLFVLLILMQNLMYLGWDNFDSKVWFVDSFQLFLIMIGMEMVVDLVKHGFICKNNGFDVEIYRAFYIRLSMDFTNARRMNEIMLMEDGKEKKLFFMDRRLGFVSLPLVALFLRIMWQLSEYNNDHVYVKLTFIVILAIIAYITKLLLSLIMIAKSVNKLKNTNLNDQYLIAKQLSNVTRYALIVKKIPV